MPLPSRPRVPKSRSDAVPNAAIERVARAAEALRRGEAVRLKGLDGKTIAARAVEAVPDHALLSLKGSPRLLLTHSRAHTLKIRLYTPGVVALALEPPLHKHDLLAIADPTADLAAPLKGPFQALREPLPDAYAQAVKLAKLAGLLPAVVATNTAPKDATAVSAEDISGYEAATIASLKIITRARVPLESAEHAELVAFRAGDSLPEHYAIVIGAPRKDRPVLTRVHSECFTGDLLGSLRCDCGPQLRGAIQAIAKAGAGVLLYLAQEGRGIGLINKLRAYRLQDQGFDTLEANTRLGFEEDERLYGVAARMLTLLGFSSVKLMTNNPAKVTALESAGLKVARRVALKFPSNRHNSAYLAAKKFKAGHWL